jgi:hypothetical protein
MESAVASFQTRTDVATRPGLAFAHIIDLDAWPTFRGFGPVPGIVEAKLVNGTTVGPGSRIRVTNTDGSVHHEVMQVFEHGRHVTIQMELTPPASYVMAGIEERVDVEAQGDGTRITRTFIVRPRWFFTAPIGWLIAHGFLHRAVVRHNEAVRAALVRGPALD